MNKKIILVIFSIILIIGSAYFVMDYLENEPQNNDVHNRSFVKNCIPGGPDKIVPAIGIYNSTHTFDLRFCTWVPIEK